MMSREVILNISMCELIGSLEREELYVALSTPSISKPILDHVCNGIQCKTCVPKIVMADEVAYTHMSQIQWSEYLTKAREKLALFHRNSA